MEFRDAQMTLWGQSGAWAYDSWHEFNVRLFASELEYAGVVWGLTPHGGKLGFCAPSGRIALHPSLVDPSGARPWGWPASRFTDRLAADVLVHEMIHARLFAQGVSSDDRGGHHNTREWCEQIMRLSPLVLGVEINAEPVKPRRVDGKVQRKPRNGCLTRGVAATWPHSVRPRAASYYTGGRRLSFNTERKAATR